MFYVILNTLELFINLIYLPYNLDLQKLNFSMIIFLLNHASHLSYKIISILFLIYQNAS